MRLVWCLKSDVFPSFPDQWCSCFLYCWIFWSTPSSTISAVIGASSISSDAVSGACVKCMLMTLMSLAFCLRFWIIFLNYIVAIIFLSDMLASIKILRWPSAVAAHWSLISITRLLEKILTRMRNAFPGWAWCTPVTARQSWFSRIFVHC